MTSIQRAVAAYRELAKEMPKGYKPNLSAICRTFKVHKSTLWYALRRKP